MCIYVCIINLKVRIILTVEIPGQALANHGPQAIPSLSPYFNYFLGTQLHPYHLLPMSTFLLQLNSWAAATDWHANKKTFFIWLFANSTTLRLGTFPLKSGIDGSIHYWWSGDISGGLAKSTQTSTAAT